MSHPETCGACGMKIEPCTDCGGLICSVDCPDRAEDGCTCGEEDDEDE